MYISPAEISKKTGLDKLDVNKVLQELLELGILRRKFVCVCGNCKQINSEYDIIGEIPETFTCKNCGKETENIFDDTYVVFKY